MFKVIRIRICHQFLFITLTVPVLLYLYIIIHMVFICQHLFHWCFYPICKQRVLLHFGLIANELSMFDIVMATTKKMITVEWFKIVSHSLYVLKSVRKESHNNCYLNKTFDAYERYKWFCLSNFKMTYNIKNRIWFRR